MSKSNLKFRSRRLGAVLMTGACLQCAVAMAAPQALDCLIEPAQSAEVAAGAQGVLENVLVERGATVKKGQLLATLTSEVEQANREASRQRASNEAEIAAAAASVEVSRAKLARVRQLTELGFGSEQELDQARGESEIAVHKLEQARENRKVAARELAVAERQLQLRQERSPIDGVIADRLLQPGERVDGKALFKIMKLDELRIEVVAPSAMFGVAPEGSMVSVTPEIARSQARPAKVVQVDRFIDAASGTFRMRLNLDNRDGQVPAGVRCKVAFEGASPAPSANGPRTVSEPAARKTRRPGAMAEASAR